MRICCRVYLFANVYTAYLTRLGIARNVYAYKPDVSLVKSRVDGLFGSENRKTFGRCCIIQLLIKG